MTQDNRSVSFFDQQFQRQVRAGEFALNPFEQAALPYLKGTVLDLGCGLGNLAIEAARQGCTVTAVDASATAIERIRRAAAAESLAIEGVRADLGSYRITDAFDTIAAIGLLMFFPQACARGLLEEIQRQVKPGGRAVVNVLIEGTTFLGMFEPGHYYLFGKKELEKSFAGWKVLLSERQEFPAPGDTRKVFATVVAEKAA